ncbi:hypothetical protein [Candidatus Scalindua japonica]|nr:hypothetical protein [Candidatus Scalindua japonica]
MKIKCLIFLVLFISLVGCSNHLVYVHEADLGLTISPVNPNSGTAKFSFGYDRDTYAIVPKRGDNKDSMSLTAVSRVHSKGMQEVQFGHVVATGEAAKAIAENPYALETAKRNLKK